MLFIDDAGYICSHVNLLILGSPHPKKDVVVSWWMSSQLYKLARTPDEKLKRLSEF